ncbi:MAG: 50S ribosomal protein L24 [Dehalococcoidia bacterium]|nr:50S ribosomal protein L24 [Dehalococcoidia bacterium]
MAKTKIRRGDDVLVIAGKDKGRTGRVLGVITEKNRVVVEGVNVVTKHYKPRPGIRQGGRVQQEASIHISNVKLIQSNYTEPSSQFRSRDE